MRLARTALPAALVAGLVALPAAAGERVLAIGDIHGSLEGITTILRESGLTDAAGRWTGGRARVVQTGDYTDRGDDVRAVLDLLMELEGKARAGRGELTVLLGNHEMLNLMHHDADVVVNPRIYASFADDRSAERRRRASQDWRKWLRRRERIAGLPPPVTASEEDWLAGRPPGFFAYYQAMSARGRYGRWLRRLPVVHRIDDSIFLHGGLSEPFAQLSLERINELHRQEIQALDDTIGSLERKAVIPPFSTWSEVIAELDSRLAGTEEDRQREMIAEARERLDRFLTVTASPNSPLWYRGFAQPPHGLADEELARLRDLLVGAYGARRFVVAHSPFHGDEISVRLETFFLIDTGMLAAVYGGRPSALEIAGDEVAAIYPGQRRRLVGAPRPAAAGGPWRPPAPRATPAIDLGGPRVALAAAPPPGAAEKKEFVPPARSLRDPAGELLPFATPEEVERFLANATVVDKVPIGEGKTGALRLDLEHEGVRARAVFHDIDDRRGPASGGGPIRMSGGATMLRFRDSYSGQVAAYRLALLMGLDNVPPAVIRKIDGVEGSLALWIEGGTTLTEWLREGKRQPQNAYYQHQIYDMRVFDVLINNKDRNTGNILWTPDWTVWLIDHTRTFAQDVDLYRPELVQRCSRALLAKIEALDESAALAELKPYLSTFEVKAIFKRRKRLLRYLSDRVDKLGAERVFFDYGDPLGVVVVTGSAGASI